MGRDRGILILILGFLSASFTRLIDFDIFRIEGFLIEIDTVGTDRT